MKSLLLFLLKVYKKMISPMLGDCCRFTPSCSDYTYRAVEEYGVGKGLFYGIKRICRCHPFNEGGYDPVPKSNKVRENGK